MADAVHTRRAILRAIPALGVAASISAEAAAEPQKTRRDLAIWHMRELERLAIEDGAGAAMIVVMGRPAAWHGKDAGYSKCKTLMIDHRSVISDEDAMFAERV